MTMSASRFARLNCEELDSKLRVSVPQSRGAGRQEPASEPARSADPDDPLDVRCRPADGFAGAEGEPLHLFGDRQHPRARLGEAVAGRAPVEQFGLEAVLQARQPPRQGRMVDSEPGRRRGQPSGPGDGEEAPEVVPVELRHM
jgi:hypothetical protein